jgi:hypothetical protein
MVFVVGVALVMTAALIVCVPLLSARPREDVRAGAIDAALRWEKQKRDALSAIREAELDHQMGKLSPDDYEVIRAAQEHRAVEAMKALEGSDRKLTRARACGACGKKSVGTADVCPACGEPLAA